MGVINHLITGGPHIVWMSLDYDMDSMEVFSYGGTPKSSMFIRFSN